MRLTNKEKEELRRLVKQCIDEGKNELETLCSWRLLDYKGPTIRKYYKHLKEASK